ncbi:endo-1,3(4)-beta-glucanase, partial [Ascoidea rubescens DSM 1968]
NKPIYTNKFYTNFILENQQCSIWTHPYSLSFSKVDGFNGLAVSHITNNQKTFSNDNIPHEFFINPIGIKSIIFSSTQFRSLQDPNLLNLSLNSLNHSSVNLNLSLPYNSYNSNENGNINFPIVQGLGFITGIYNNLTPLLQSTVGFRSIERLGNLSNNIQKYKIVLFNDIVWSVYVSNYSNPNFNLTKIDNNNIQSNVLSNCTIQVATGFSQFYDLAAGLFVYHTEISSEVIDANSSGSPSSNSSAVYSFNFKTAGYSLSSKPIMFALPHHYNNFSNYTNSGRTDIYLDSTTKGVMAGYLIDKFEIVHYDLPVNITFFPGTSLNYQATYNNNSLGLIRKAAEIEVSEDVMNLSNLDSMYFAGKKLDKYALVLYSTMYILQDRELTLRLLPKLKNAFNRFSKLNNIQPLIYDNSYKGLISRAGINGDPNLDFGNSYYNDHHFHYSYFIHAAAIIGKVELDLNDGRESEFLNENKDFVDFLVRDVCNPSPGDNYFPQFRSFDWFNGHSWAKGLFASADGKDEESSSEDYHCYYSIKLWSIVVKNDKLGRLMDLILSVMKNSITSYMLMDNDNKIQPKEFIGNKVTGIFFENKIHHTTYFGNNLEYIQGIHMLPITPISSYFRSPKFVKEEWEEKLSSHIDKVDGGWKGILMLNTALFDPGLAWNFFGKENFNYGYLDDGMSLTWSLAFVAGVGG